MNIKNRKESMIRCSLIISNILISVIIFIFSSQPAEISDPVSKGFIYNILSFLTKILNIESVPVAYYADMLNGIVRKLAHFSIYMTLSIFMNLLFLRYDLRNLKRILIAVLICVLYAISDEIHQYFVPGRSCEIRDMLIDSSGVLTGVIITYSVRFVMKIFKRKQIT